MNFSSSAECPPPPWPPRNPIQRETAAADRFREKGEGREHARENHQHGSYQNREPVGLFDGQILRNHFAEDDVRIADEQERDPKADGVPHRLPARHHERLNQRLEQLIDGILAGPSQAQTGERDAGLGERKQPGWIRQQIERGLRADLSLFGQRA